jgi:group II intron reverse transcriptase/maturase
VGRVAQVLNRNATMHDVGKSDVGVVPLKGQNKPGKPGADVLEGRPATKGNLLQTTVTGAQYPEPTLSGLERIRQVARREGELRFTSLYHHITPALLMEAFASLKKMASPGVDGVTWQEYEEGVYGKIAKLHDHVQSGTYRALPSKRAWIPKSDGRQRPLGIAALEDKIVQRAVGWILEVIYEEEFTGFSYGFRPKRSQHQALDAICVGVEQRPVNWILDADIKGFFDALDHEWLMKFLEHRIADQRMLGLIRKWLRAGVSEDGEWSKTMVGTPQGAVISPLLANVYLHYVLDLWVQWWRKHHATGVVIIVRYADDFVLGFENKADADKLLTEVSDRFAKFGLALHPEKTRLIEFGKKAKAARQARGERKPETFNFLGFTHVCAQRRSDKRFMVLRQTMSKRMRTKVVEIREELRGRLNDSIAIQGAWIRRVVQGYFNYHGVPCNGRALLRFQFLVEKAWFWSLRRRGQRNKLNWKEAKAHFAKWIPSVRICHPYPNQRLCVNYPR